MPTETTARQLRNLVEPVAAQVYFAPEAIAGYPELGLNFIEGYFCSRGASLGRDAPWSVVSASFAHFDPGVVERAIASGSTKTEIDALVEARQRGSEAQLARLLGEPDEQTARATAILRELTDGLNLAGRTLFAALSVQPWPGTPFGDLWRAADLVREHRGDAHIAAWMGIVDACEITLLTELSWGMPSRAYVFTRGWDTEVVDAAEARLQARGLIGDGQLTPAGKELREEIEARTDQSEAEVVARLGDRADELFDLLRPMDRAIVEGGGYPASIDDFIRTQR
jgi:hypothetical protein